MARVWEWTETRGYLSFLNCKNPTWAKMSVFVLCYCVWDVIMMLLFHPYSIQFCSRASKLYSHHGSAAMWEEAQKGLVCGSTCWQSTALLPTGLCFEKRHRGIWCVTSAPLCAHEHVEGKGRKGKERKGFSDELGGDIPSYRACKRSFHRINKVGRNFCWVQPLP